VPDSTAFTAPEIWDYLNDEGLSTGVVNLPMSYPPRELDGVMVAGGPRSRETGYTHPPDLEAVLEARGYRVHPERVVTSNEDDIEPTLELIEKRFETARWLIDEYDLDFLHLTIFHLNVLQHYFHDGEPTRRAWEIIDEQLGHFVDEGHDIFLMSDHGCAEIDTVFYVNEWLQERGSLQMNTTVADYLLKTGLTQERLASVVRSLNLEATLRERLPRRVIERFPDEEGIKRDNKFDKLDAERSIAIASGQGLIYVLVDPDDSRYDETVDALVEDLQQLTTPAGTPVAIEVYRGEDLYPDGDPRYRPDVVYDQGPGVHTSGAVGKGAVFGRPGRWAAENVRYGLFLAYGDDIPATGDIGRISILDIAPTILHSMGLPVPNDFEGHPVEAVAPDRPVTYREPLPNRATSFGGDDDTEAAEQRLADLGYLE
jgi:predicted AlkP superfamily phosphohydrolase/phosphomutase